MTTYPATFEAPEFLRLDVGELTTLLSILRHPLTVHLYLLIVAHSTFTSGEMLASYGRLIELMTPPRPERGRRVAAPTLKQVRRALDDLVRFGLVKRGRDNEPQGQLRLKVRPRKNPTKPKSA